MTRKTMGLLSLLLVLAMAASGYAAAVSLPVGAELPLHWDLHGNVDRSGSKWEALLSPVAITALIALIFYALPHLEPRERGLERSQGLYRTMWLGLLIVMTTSQLAMLSVALGWGLPILALIQGAIGLLFVLVGNQFGKSRRMYLTGIRTPWTLASEEVWIATHRLAGKLMMAGGLLLILASLLPLPPAFHGTLLLGTVIVSLVLPAIWSFFLWRRERGRPQPSE